MTKRVLLSAASPGMAAVDAALADLATDASGNGAQFLAGDGTWKAPAVSSNGSATAVAGAATLNTLAGQVTSESLSSATTYTLTLTNSQIKSTSTVLVTGYPNPITSLWLISGISPANGSVTISLANLTAPFTGTLQINFAVFN